ncbi:MAG: riboflavin synthase subunit beta [Winogradskyella sp.]|nr:riboflavin synthase subunit beta [Winogradskyella sp.]NNC46243.1 riboflavin synthase subunit beta [Winogradskyella sp.]NNF86000.1 riboflavin synthase subunit beta [Winogradskyella sp.]NNK39645.1 riboflavin synthase subunit beta [Winogradskyella sp.]NNL81970.1 riboflavin synthase subunit beta [Winogradskyella sp.]
MGLFKLRKNKKFDYTPRYYKGEGNPYEVKRKFDDYRTTIAPPKGIKAKLKEAVSDYKYNPDYGANKRVLIIIIVLVLIFLFIIDFDLTIFFTSR